MRKMGALLAAGLIAATLALPLNAQESGQSRDGTPPPVKLKSEKKAMTMSIVATVVPWAVFLPLGLRESHEPGLNGGETVALVAFLAIPLGPSLGYFYAGATGRGLLGMGLRLVGMAGIIGGSASLFNDDADESLMTGLVVAGACVLAGSYILDFAGLKKAVRRHNLKVQGLQVSLAPVVSPRSKTLGFQLRLGF